MLTIRKNLTSLTLDFIFVIRFDQDKGIFFQNLSSLSANLHTLHLQGLRIPSSNPGDYDPRASLDPAMNFPRDPVSHPEGLFLYKRHRCNGLLATPPYLGIFAPLWRMLP